MKSLCVLVTGAGGMIGRLLEQKLVPLAARVIATYRVTPDFEPPPGAIIGDLADKSTRDAAFRALASTAPEDIAVIHLAGLADAAVATNNHHAAFAANTALAQQIIESALEHNIRRFVLASTGLVYGRTSIEPLVESITPQPKSIYAATKYASEILAHAYAIEGPMSCDILRFSNVYGPDSPENTVTGRILAQLRRGEQVKVATLIPVRDFLFIEDAVSAILAVLDHDEKNGCRVYNASSGKGVSIAELVDTAVATAGGAAPPSAAYSTSDDAVVLSNQLLRSHTGWQPRYSLSAGLAKCLVTRDNPAHN